MLGGEGNLSWNFFSKKMGILVKFWRKKFKI